MSTPDLSAALRMALLARLRSEAPKTGLACASAVHDGLPVSPAFPYLTLGESRFRPLTADGGEYLFTLSVWSNEASPLEAHEIAAEIQTSLATPLTGDAFHATGFAMRQNRVSRQSQGKRWQAEMTGRIFAQKQPGA